MVWKNDTPHSISDRQVYGKNGAQKAAAHIKRKAKLEKIAEQERMKKAGIKPPKRPSQVDLARRRLAGGEEILFTLPNNWTWGRTGKKVAAATLAALREKGWLEERSPALLPGEPGQSWGASSACSTEAAK